jgi:hypothetical protein
VRRSDHKVSASADTITSCQCGVQREKGKMKSESVRRRTAIP